jgi:RNA-directed DNA polymerase
VLRLRHPWQLTTALQTTPQRLLDVLDRADQFYEDLVLLDPRKPGKQRMVTSPRGPMRTFQELFYHRVLLAWLERSPHSHGGIPGRSLLTNVRPHLGHAFVFTTDVSNFYPSIHQQRVFDLFTRLGWSPEVARLSTRLCTYRNHLAQGLLTSPILADQLLRPVDDRIGAACRKIGAACRKASLTYTRVVDDIAISGSFDLEHSGFPGLVRRILAENGFTANEEKDQFGSVSGGATITKIRFPRGHPDVQKAYCDEVIRQLRDAACLGRGAGFDGPYYTEAQITGRVLFICWVNPGRRRVLLPMLRGVDWRKVRKEAQRQGLEVMREELVRPAESTSACLGSP